MMKSVLLPLAALLALGGVTQARAELAIIAHPQNSLMGISKDEIRDIYRGLQKTFAGGGRVEAVDQAAGSAARDKFNNDVLQMNESRRKSYWSKLMFTGKGKPPRVLNGDEAIRDWVASHPEAVGYIDGGKLDSRVKVLLILP